MEAVLRRGRADPARRLITQTLTANVSTQVFAPEAQRRLAGGVAQRNRWRAKPV
jgi:hypothetical protein